MGRKEFLRDHGKRHRSVGAIETRFDGIEGHLIELIAQSDVALGAIAWLTNERLLDALAQLKRASFVVQKEDFLRPDLTDENKQHFSRRLRRQYDQLRPLSSNDFLDCYPGSQEGMPGHNYSVENWLIAADGQYIQTDDAVRCIGFQRNQSKLSVPTMHHKFAVFGIYRPDVIILPTCVVTGSFNWSANAQVSRENIVTIFDKRVCNDYVSEWAQLWALSEELDWSQETPRFPSHYIGT
ncbi:phospholipase D-like domain-containing protein [Pelagimonas phthalicica]|uniref:phospholipase D-like domain-containing protein n=1 Tax=Pelagimonas phthalicica TaxID=1037362 RepID=UPI00105DA60B|nr:phospholipase D-like domain-containing protein [Pelagimonas phthalicica]